ARSASELEGRRVGKPGDAQGRPENVRGGGEGEQHSQGAGVERRGELPAHREVEGAGAAASGAGKAGGGPERAEEERERRRIERQRGRAARSGRAPTTTPAAPTSQAHDQRVPSPPTRRRTRRKAPRAVPGRVAPR